MRWFYTLFNVCVAGGPLVASWLWCRDALRLRYRLLLAWTTVSVAWIVLDALSVARGWWDYNDAYVYAVRVLGLPLEEIAFFITVPLACMLTFYMLHKHIKGEVRPLLARGVVAAMAVGIVGFVVLSGAHERTVADGLLALIVLVLLYRSSLWRTRSVWVWNGVILALCLICNTVLTALPVVVYDVHFMSGLYVGTIPIEDLLYNFSLLNLTLLVVRPDTVAE